VADLVEEALDQLLAEKAPRPELHSPDQVDGDVADVPFFPNSVVEAVPHARLGNYRLVRLLGHGGFANVYLGEHIHLNTHAAIKLLHTSLTDDERAKFLEEARTIALLEHPHIVRVLEYGVEHETPFLVMNYAPGGTLRQLHPKGTRLPPATIVSYVEQVAEALQYAHDQKIVHRDVKPENMLLGRGNEVLLSDFGIAVIAHSTQSQALQEVGGTAPYMAPEQIQVASGSSDDTVQVWSPSASGTLHYSGLTDSVQAVAWSSDGQHLASGSSDQMVRVWDLSPNGNPYVYHGHTDEVYTVAWSPGGFAWPWSHEGQRLASGGKDTTVRIWQAV